MTRSNYVLKRSERLPFTTVLRDSIDLEVVGIGSDDTSLSISPYPKSRLSELSLMSTSLSVSLQIFIQKLEGLKDWPDKNVILELTAITEKNIGFAEHFANIIMARLTNEQTHASYKLPMFYVIDAIMKHVGGPFANLFSVKFSEGYVRALFDLHQKDRDKLKFLLDTWDERSFMTFDLIRKMKALLDTPAANRPTVQPTVAHLPPANTPIVPPPVYSRPKAIPAAVPAPVVPKFTPIPAQSEFRAPPVVDTRETSQLIFADIVLNEMVAMLNTMYAEMNVSNPMSLDDLSRANPSLYAQIRGKAEEAARVIIAKRKVSGSPVVRTQAQVQGQGQGRYVAPSPTLRNNSYNDDVTGHKRAAPANTTARTYPPAAHTANPSTHANSSASNYQQYTSRFNNTSANSTQSQGRYRQESPVRSNTTQDRRPNPNTTSITTDIQHAHLGDADEHLQEEMLSKYASDYFVNGFLCEVPVVVDVARVQALRDVLHSQYNQATNPTGFEAASESVTKRLNSYLNDVQVPPRLPQILFGPLPLRPIYALSAEAVEEQSAKSKASGAASSAAAAAVEKAKVKLPVPPFRTEELGRNPETHVAALYHSKPHQFHEDGLRFATLALLTQHTDKFIQVRKLQQKKGAVREYREWYCSNAQWVTDFNSNSSGAGGVVSSSGAGNSSSTNNNTTTNTTNNNNTTPDNVEYVVQADEHFTRCPVSRETFECVWDEQEGEMLYRNAVKVLLTEAADPALYTLAQPIPWLDNTNNTSGGALRYLIVHKNLVLDAWLSSGRAVPLQDAVARYKAGLGGESSRAEQLSRAVGEEDDEEDIFVLLEFK